MYFFINNLQLFDAKIKNIFQNFFKCLLEYQLKYFFELKKQFTYNTLRNVFKIPIYVEIISRFRKLAMRDYKIIISSKLINRFLLK